MPATQMSHKNSLSIRLTESAVFLRTSDGTGRHRSSDSQPSMLRGLLTLELVKPTRISSIELELAAKTSTAWPEGIGARRIEVTEEHKIFSASATFFRAGPAPRRTASIGPGIACSQGEEWEENFPHPDTPRNHEEANGLHSPPLIPRFSRRVSVDSSVFQSIPQSRHEDLHLARIPPYTPIAESSSPTPPERPSANDTPSNGPITRPEDNPAQTLEDFRNALWAGLDTHRRNSPGGFSPGRVNGSSSPSLRSAPLSRRPSIEDVPEYEPGPSYPRSPHSFSPPPPADSSGNRSPSERRGRRHSRFSLASVSNALMDVIKSNSPKQEFTHSRERPNDQNPDSSRGRTLEKGKANVNPAGSGARPSKERFALSKFGEILKLDGDDKKESGDGWKEFKKGTYTYAISFQIPGNSPPTLQCNFGSVRWRLKGVVHRPGAFQSKLSVSREVVVILSPGDEDTEESDNIVVERHWDSQLQYLISISGRSFYIGGSVPVQFTMMPLAKIKIHRISVYVEERVDYYTQMKRIARTDPITRIQLLSLKHNAKTAGPILPLDSDDADAFKNSPLYQILTPDDDPSEVASTFMGPGPWTFHQDLKLPASCATLHFSNRNRRSNMSVTHVLKCVIRVERGDDTQLDLKTGKRKLFDIVVQTPVHILSCRCNPEWTSLPRYSEPFEDPSAKTQSCPCDIKRLAAAEEYRASLRAHIPATLERMTSRRSSDSSASTAETTPINPVTMPSLHRLESLFDQNTQFERLVSGQESEMGEAPPAYDSVGRPVATANRN